MAVIELKQVSHYIPVSNQSTPLFTNINLTVQAGEIMILLGQSGSGKTTLLNLIAGLELPHQGEIYLHQQPMHHQSATTRATIRRQHIGFVYQQYNLLPSLTVLENVMLPGLLNKQRQVAERARDLLQTVDMGQLLNRFPHQLSGGEQQRVAICRSLIHQPSVLLADEPTGSLDNTTAARVIELFFSQVNANRQTVLLATHNEQLCQWANRVAVIHYGQLSFKS
ncbi:ABC transporter ATP-binding protein [Spartinivicinus poritis]|uniref:ABC transporter ATP-binding protein n=1 Tax=Spartinivicinus poritis TaxID=2994640 RepID=A0ABT5U760_9GAMM|nr:ABC transporter ATP-binding protein [Spartinivicinus sp. A2-2]MDE1462204.1 ABC transporter ATP-binding protein [Spartinivicinus sp. A2-2]